MLILSIAIAPTLAILAMTVKGCQLFIYRIISAKHTIFHTEFVYLEQSVTEINCCNVTDMLTRDFYEIQHITHHQRPTQIACELIAGTDDTNL